MRKLLVTTALVSIILGSTLNAQTPTEDVYHKRLYYTGKVWGLMKYFHSEVAKGGINWDEKLIETLADVKSSVSMEDFTNALLGMLDSAGDMALPTSPLPEVPDSLKSNLDFEWLNDAMIPDEVRIRLDTVLARFRPQSNHFVVKAQMGSNPKFDSDNQFYGAGVDEYPAQEKRLLALFRYWNIVNYFYPYKYIIDQNWDSTLVEFIPGMLNATDEVSYHLSFMELVTRINDTHAMLGSNVISLEIYGGYFLPLTLKHTEDETVVVRVIIDNEAVEAGDVIKSINGRSIYSIRDSLRNTTAGSNDPAIERTVNYRVLRGKKEILQLTVEGADGNREIELQRDVTATTWANLTATKGDIWKKLDGSSGTLGYVDMSRLEVKHIESMFNDLWDTDGIIFDIRGYPQTTMWSMVPYLFDAPISAAKFLAPDCEYPGTMDWLNVTVGTGDFSRTYDKHVLILMDERTQSQAEYTVMAFEQHPKAVKIGSQTAGADGNVAWIYLPGGMRTYLTALGVFYPDGRETQRIGIVPDVEVHSTIAGIREGRDEVLEAALQYDITGIAEDRYDDNLRLPDTYLFPAHPNPFTLSTLIKYNVSRPGSVSLKIHDMTGRVIKTLVGSTNAAGDHHVRWDGRDEMMRKVGAGVYFIQLQMNESTVSRKILLMK